MKLKEELAALEALVNNKPMDDMGIEWTKERARFLIGGMEQGWILYNEKRYLLAKRILNNEVLV